MHHIINPVRKLAITPTLASPLCPPTVIARQMA